MMKIEDITYEFFQGKAGSIYDVYDEGKTFQFKMKLIDVRLGKTTVPPKWEPMVPIRQQQFSLFFESDRKIHLHKNMYVDGDCFDFFPLKIEAIDESKTGFIYQACFN